MDTLLYGFASFFSWPNFLEQLASAGDMSKCPRVIIKE